MLTKPIQQEPPVILIGGPPRCGKTLLGSALAQEIDGRLVSFDKARHKFTAFPTGPVRRIARANACLDIIVRHCTTSDHPIVIEGSDLVYRGRNNTKRALQLLLLLRNYFGCRVLTMGCGDKSVEEKAEAIARYALQSKDWLYAKADGCAAEIAEIARDCAVRTLEDSAVLRKASEQSGIAYLSVRSRHFVEDLNASLQELVASLSFPVGAGE